MSLTLHCRFSPYLCQKLLFNHKKCPLLSQQGLKTPISIMRLKKPRLTREKFLHAFAVSFVWH